MEKFNQLTPLRLARLSLFQGCLGCLAVIFAGMLNRIMAGLSQFNHQITDSMYDESGRLLSCRLVVYASSDDARDGINPLTTIEVSSSYDEKQNMKTFVSAEEKKVT